MPQKYTFALTIQTLEGINTVTWHAPDEVNTSLDRIPVEERGNAQRRLLVHIQRQVAAWLHEEDSRPHLSVIKDDLNCMDSDGLIEIVEQKAHAA